MTNPALPLIFLLLASCDDTPGKWSAYVYPDAKDQSNWVRTDKFKTRRLCNRAAQESIARLPEPKRAAYKCVVLEPI